MGSMIPNTPQEKPVASAMTAEKTKSKHGRSWEDILYWTRSPDRNAPGRSIPIISISTHAKSRAAVAPATFVIP